MKEELIAEVTQQMLPCLNNSQLKQLRQVLNHIFIHYEITDIKTNPIEDYNYDLTENLSPQPCAARQAA